MTKNGLEGKRLADKSDKAEKATRRNDLRRQISSGIGECDGNAAHIAALLGRGHGGGADAASSEKVVERHGFPS